MIDEKKLIESINNQIKWMNNEAKTKSDEDFIEGLKVALALIDEYPKVGEWILCSERLPEANGYGHYFLCCLKNGVIRILGYSKELFTTCPSGFYYEKGGLAWKQDVNHVIAWQPLPEPYKEE